MNLFVRYYETHFHKKSMKDKRTKVEMVVHCGSYNFVPKKTKGTASIVPAYRNKWPSCTGSTIAFAVTLMWLPQC